jgi:hypothetical protein
MDKFLATVPKNLLATAAILGGTLFIIFSDPPHTVCESQLGVLKENQKNFLYLDPKSKIAKVTKYERMRDHCKGTNSPGGCYELFQDIRMLLQDLGTVPSDCLSRAGAIPQVRKAIWETAELLVKLAWGSTPPAAYYAKFGWLDTADISLFCRLKNRIVATYGEGSFTSFRERMMLELPGAKDISRNQVWDMSIFSENCARYP